MDHLVILTKSWRLLPKIINGTKTIESRWHKTKRVPWKRVKKGDTLYFKNSGEPVTVKAEVTKVLQFSDLDQKKTRSVLARYGKSDLGITQLTADIRGYIFNKKYCILVFFNQVRQIKPFKVDKTGYGMQAAWITVDDINRLREKD